MATTLSEIKVKIGGDVAGLKRALGKAQKSLKDAGRKMSRAGSTLTRAVSAPLAAIGGASVKAFADFDKAMTNSLSIMSDVTDMQKRDMTEAAKQVARETTLSAEQAAESYFFLASAGLDAAKSIESLPQVARLAQAGAFDMATATDLATDTMTSLGLEVEDLTRITDVMTRTNELANTSVEQLGRALTNQAGPALRGVNKSIEEGAAVLGVFADQGIKGEKAGVRLRQTIDALTQNYNANSEAFEELNIELFDSQGNMRNMADIVEDFEDSMGGMSAEAKSAAFEQLGLNVRVRSGIQALMGNSRQLRTYEKELRNAGGTTQRVADKQMQSFSNQMELVKQNVVLAAIELGENLAPVATKAANFISDLASRIEQMSERTQALVLGVSSLAASFGPVLVVVGKAITVLGGLGAAIGTLVGGGAVIAALAGGAGLIVDNWKTLRTWFGEFYASFRQMTEDALGRVHDFWVSNKDDIVSTVNALLDNTIGILRGLFDTLKPIVKTALGVIVAVWDEWGDNILSTVRTAFQTLVGLVVSLGEALEGAFNTLAGLLTGDWGRMWKGIKQLTVGVWNAIVEIIGTGITTLLNTLEAGFSWLPVIGPKIDDARDAVKNFIDDSLKAKVESDSADLEQSVADAHQGAESAVDSAGRGISSVWDSIADKSVEVFGGGGSATQAVKQGADEMKKSFDVTSDAIKENFVQAVQAAEQNLEPFEQAVDTSDSAVQRQRATIDESVKSLESKKQALLEAEAKSEEYKRKVQEVADKIQGEFEGALESSVRALLTGRNAFATAIDEVKRRITNLLTKGITKFITKMIKGESSFTGVLSKAGDAISNVLSRIGSGGGGSGGGAGLIGKLGSLASSIASTAGPIAGMIAGFEGLSRAVTGQSWLKGMISGFGELAEGIRNADEELKGSGFFGGGRQTGGGTQGSGVSVGSVGESISKIRGFNENTARQVVGEFVRRAQGGANLSDLARFLAGRTNESYGSILADYDLREAQARVARGAPQLQRGGVVMGDMLARIGENIPQSGPEVVLPLTKVPSLVRGLSQNNQTGSMKQQINLYLDKDLIAEAAAEGLPNVLDLRNLR